MPATITIQLIVPLTAIPGDYAMLYANGGDGAMDWDSPVDSERLDLFPGGNGILGFGLAPFGLHSFGLPLSVGTQGFGLAPFGLHPFGLGATVITKQVSVADCGDWLFGFKTFDAAGNPNTGTPGSASAAVHITPAAPLGLTTVSYDPTTGNLTLAVDDPTGGQIIGLPSRIAGINGAGGIPGGPGRIGKPTRGGLVGSGATLPTRINEG
jgi:hypothetical protein